MIPVLFPDSLDISNSPVTPDIKRAAQTSQRPTPRQLRADLIVDVQMHIHLAFFLFGNFPLCKPGSGPRVRVHVASMFFLVCDVAF